MYNYTLSINPGVTPLGSHDPSAVLFEDSKLVYGIEEERLIRQKHALEQFPKNAIQACLDYAGIELSGVDKVTIPWEPDLFRQSLPMLAERSVPGCSNTRPKK